MPISSSKKFLEVIASDTDPSVLRARRSLEEMARRLERTDRPLGRVGLAVLDTSVVWAGIAEEGVHRPHRATMFLTRGLVDRLSQEEILAVMAHEWGHVAEKSTLSDWALRLAGLTGSLTVHVLLVGLLVRDDMTSVWPWVASVLAAGSLAVLALLWLERFGQHRQELICDRFAAQVVGPATMVATLRRVDALLNPAPRPPSRRGLWQWSTATHPSLSNRVWNIVRFRHRVPRLADSMGWS